MNLLLYNKLASLLIIFFIHQISTKEIVPQNPECMDPLGMENKDIADDQLTAPPNAYQYGFGAYHARLNNYKAYCTPGGGIGGFHDEVYMEINLKREFIVTAFGIQGDRDSPYSNRIKISYSNGEGVGSEENNTFILSVNGKKGDNIEHVPIPAIRATKIKVQLENGDQHKCVRLEVYGCEYFDLRYNAYEECDKKDTQPLLQQYSRKMDFTQSDFTIKNTNNSVRNLVYSKPLAWCLATIQTQPYETWAVIDMRGEFLIYGIEIKGVKRNLPDYFKLQFSLNGENKSLYDLAEQTTTKFYTKKLLQVPLIARYIWVSMHSKIDQPNSCMKLELYGCPISAPNFNVVLGKSTDNRRSNSILGGQISDLFLGLILLLVMILFVVIAVGIIMIRRKRGKPLQKRPRGPLPDVPVYSNLNQEEIVDAKEVYVDCSRVDCSKDPIYEDPNYASVADVNPYENAPFHLDKREEKKYQNT